MSRSPKRNGLILERQPKFVFDEDNWPLQDSPPALTMSPTTSEENLMPPTPPNEQESILLPGFHFSTTDENVDPAEFHRMAAQLLSGQASPKRDSCIAEDLTRSVMERNLHCDLGKDPSGRFCCSCGKSYSTTFRLREHMQACAGTSKFPCSTCDKVFETREKREQHVQQRHNDNKEACPECGEEFPATQLPKHLASGLGGCDGMIQASMGPQPEIDEAYREDTYDSPSQQYWIYDGDLTWAPKSPITPNDDVDSQTLAFITKLIRRDTRSEICDLCGEEPSDLAAHIGSHSLDFNEKRHRCDECMIYFANEKDLTRHLQSADLNQHCGFTFRHNAAECTGHHPPTYYKAALDNDHYLMQKHLWAWELSQLRVHRVTVARVLAERLLTRPPSVVDARRSYLSLLPHVSVASATKRDSIKSNNENSEDVTEMIDSHLSRIMSQCYPDISFFPDIAEEENEDDDNEPSPADRPDSVTFKDANILKRLSKRKSFVDLVSAAGFNVSGHRRNKSNPIEFLKQQAYIDAVQQKMRPRSMTTMAPLPMVVA